MSKNRNKALLFSGIAASLFFASAFLFSPLPAYAQEASESCGLNPLCWLGNTFYQGAQYLLYGVFQVVSLLVSVAATIFGWAINPDFFSGPNGFFNLEPIYEMWKFVRDVLNLFFIFGLLFAAFATIFQVSRYSLTQNKGLLFKILLGALLVNFSFPIARALIDVANIPMYFFAQSLLADANQPATAFHSAFGASRLENILLPGQSVTDNPLSQILLAIVFMFMFGITLLVLAVQFVIRLVALLILVILSPAGFVLSAVPGMQGYGKKWWDNFLKYAFYGPVAMFMLVIATHIFAAAGRGDTSSTYVQFRETASATSVSTTTETIAAMAMFSMAIVVLWFTIGLSGRFSVYGAGTVSGYGFKAVNWGKRRAIGLGKGIASPVTTRARGAQQGLKKGLSSGKLFGVNYGAAKIKGKNIGKFATSGYYQEAREETEAKYKGLVAGGRKGAQSELEKLENKKVYEQAKEFKDTNIGNSDLVNKLRDRKADGSAKDPIEARAAAMVLAERNAITSANDFALALQDLGKNTKEVSTLIDKASGDTLKFAPDEYEKLLKSEALTMDPALKGKLEWKMKKEGNTKSLIEYDINVKGENREDVYNKYLGGMSAKDVAKIKDVHGDATKDPDAELQAFVSRQVASGNWTTKDHLDAFSELNSAQKDAWRRAKINPGAPTTSSAEEARERAKREARAKAEAEAREKRSAST